MKPPPGMMGTGDLLRELADETDELLDLLMAVTEIGAEAFDVDVARVRELVEEAKNRASRLG